MPAPRTVRIFQDSLHGLVDNPRDPLAEVMEELAEEIRQVALDKARVIIPDLPDDFLTVVTGKDTKGLFFRVQTHAGPHDDKWARYLSAKEGREHNWFAPAVQEVVGHGGVRSKIGLRRGTFPRGAGFTT